MTNRNNMFSRFVDETEQEIIDILGPQYSINTHSHYTVYTGVAKDIYVEPKQVLQCNHCGKVKGGAAAGYGRCTIEFIIDHLRDEHGLIFSSRDWRNRDV